MGERIQKIKLHLQENKKTYLVGAGCLIVGILVARKSDEEGAKIVQKVIPVLSYRPESNNVVVSLVERSTPSKPVHLKGTDQYFPSLSEAARKTGHNVSSISQQVNGKIKHVGGDVFEILESA